MKRWLLFVGALQLLRLICDLLFHVDAVQPAAWMIGFIVGLPGNVLGAALAESSLWNRSLSLQTIAIVGFVFSVLINIALAWIIGAFVRSGSRALRQRSAKA